MYNEILFNHEIKENLAIYNNMVELRGQYVKRNKPEIDKYFMIKLVDKIKKEERKVQNHRSRE